MNKLGSWFVAWHSYKHAQREATHKTGKPFLLKGNFYLTLQQVMKWTCSKIRTNMVSKFGVPIFRITKLARSRKVPFKGETCLNN